MEDGPDLKLSLFAKGVEVASSNDPSIWLSTMAMITGVKPTSSSSVDQSGEPAERVGGGKNDDDLIAKLASEIGVSRDELEGAAGPSLQPPFIHLDHKYWEALKLKPGFGRTPPPVLAATLLLLWDRHAKIGDVTTGLCGDVLDSIGLTTHNASRGFKNCDWLQTRGNAIKLNPALIRKAETLAAAYCQGRAK